MKNANGFTLVELLVVIALIAIVSTLAVNKVGGVREGAARKVSLANQKAVERAVESYLAEDGALNRLDSLLYAGAGGAPLAGGTDHDFDFNAAPSATAADGLYLGPSDDAAARETSNAGLSSSLRDVLCLYTIDAAQADALRSKLGLAYVMAATAYADAAAAAFPSLHYPRTRAFGDGSVPNAASGLDPDDAFCVATVVTNGMRFAAVNPATDLGRTVYQACGQELLNTKNWGEAYDEDAVRAEVEETGGPLLAFGLGPSASIVGKADAGLESAPTAPFLKKTLYSRYVLLFRLRTVGAGSVARVLPEFAGVLDPDGNTVRAAQSILRSF